MAKRTKLIGTDGKPIKALRVKIPEKTKMVLWARAAGRCEYSGCNRSVIGDLISGNWEMNASYIAHIVGDAPDGPRGHPILSKKLCIDISNLMLMCDTHHRLIDREDVKGHPVDLLLAMKAAHEARIETLSEIKEENSCHVLRYAARIGSNESPVSIEAIKQGLLPDRYPAEGNKTIDLDITGLELSDDNPNFWTVQIGNLQSQFAQKVRGRFERGEIRRLAVFALAPIPLLIELGRLISDIADAEVSQLLREPKGWKWQEEDAPMKIQSKRGEGTSRDIALKLEVSAPIADERIHQVMGQAIPIWSVSAEAQHNDIVRRRNDLRDFRRALRSAFEAIKTAHGESATVHLFPALPVSAAVEVGRVWMPKAHLPMIVYDQNRKLGGFQKATTIGQISKTGTAA